MKTKIENLTSPEFYSKHGGLKPATVVILFIAQVISGLSAYYGIVSTFGDSWMGQVVGVGVALICELVVRFYGYQYFLSYAERKDRVKAYDIEVDRQQLSKRLDNAKLWIFGTAALATTGFTLLGGYNYLYDRIQIDDRKDRLTVQVDQQTTASETASDIIAPLQSLASNLGRDIAKLEREVEAKDKHAAATWSKYKDSKDWTSETSIAHAWDNKGGRKSAASTLERKKQELAATQKEIAATQKQFQSAALSAASEIVDENNRVRGEQISEAKLNGSFGFVAGLIAQVLAFWMLFINASIDLGSGTVKRRVRHYLDGRSVIGDGVRVWWNRQRMRWAYVVHKYAQAPLTHKGELIDASDVTNFLVSEFLEDQGTFGNRSGERNVNEQTERQVPPNLQAVRNPDEQTEPPSRLLKVIDAQGQQIQALQDQIEHLKQKTEHTSERSEIVRANENRTKKPNAEQKDNSNKSRTQPNRTGRANAKKTNAKNKAEKMRIAGASYDEIAQEVGYAKSTVYAWLNAK